MKIIILKLLGADDSSSEGYIETIENATMINSADQKELHNQEISGEEIFLIIIYWAVVVVNTIVRLTCQ